MDKEESGPNAGNGEDAASRLIDRRIEEMGDWPTDRVPFALESSRRGVFAVGDVRSGSVKRVASGVGEGSIVVSAIHQILAEM